jgi:glycerol-3-phosphate cytidylyltransferase
MKRIGFTASAFDLLHAGHVEMLRIAREQCDYLIVGLHVDPSTERTSKHRPVQSVVERYAQLKAVKYVDEIIPYQTEQELLDIIDLFGVSVRVVGEEYKGKTFTGHDLPIETVFNERKHRFSSSELRARVVAECPK